MRPDLETSSEAKARLRKTQRAQLALIDAADARRVATQVANAVLALQEVHSARGVLACWSFGVEVPTHDLVRRLVDLGKKVYLPRVEPGRRIGAMTLHAYPCSLERLRFGLEQPVASTPVLSPADIDDVVDVALVLGLAFDHDGYRLGYGGGYFVRFFDRHRAVPVGLGFDAQRVDPLPR
ncbi:MAG: 5-formyltetrahydrofolate cyclo-ligase, partial [Acidobacteriota bacterium]